MRRVAWRWEREAWAGGSGGLRRLFEKRIGVFVAGGTGTEEDEFAVAGVPDGVADAGGMAIASPGPTARVSVPRVMSAWPTRM